MAPYQSPSHLARHLSEDAARLHDALAASGPVSISELRPHEMRAMGALFTQGLADTRYLASGDCVLVLTAAAAEAWRIGTTRAIAEATR